MKCLFVGGPIDGQVRNHFGALTEVTIPMWGGQVLDPLVTQVTYRPRTIVGKRLWAPVQWTDEAVMKQLIARYSTLIERAAKRCAA